MSKFWGFFYLGFPAKFGGFRKNWDFHTFRLAWFLKGFQAKKRLVLHVLCQAISSPLTFLSTNLRFSEISLKGISFIKLTRKPLWASLARSVPKLPHRINVDLCSNNLIRFHFQANGWFFICRVSSSNFRNVGTV